VLAVVMSIPAKPLQIDYKLELKPDTENNYGQRQKVLFQFGTSSGFTLI
jgi:hypothetical protein